jgi:hypothetical protein
MNVATAVFMENQATSEESGESSLHGIPVDPEMTRNSLMRYSSPYRLCADWMRGYFETYAEHAPDREESKVCIHITVIIKHNLHLLSVRKCFFYNLIQGRFVISMAHIICHKLQRSWKEKENLQGRTKYSVSYGGFYIQMRSP